MWATLGVDFAMANGRAADSCDLFMAAMKDFLARGRDLNLTYLMAEMR